MRKFIMDQNPMVGHGHGHGHAVENGEEGGASRIGITRGFDPSQNIIEEKSVRGNAKGGAASSIAVQRKYRELVLVVMAV